MDLERNKKTYSSEKVVRLYYSLKDSLQKSEKKILDLLKDELARMKMLDVGVGGGRTTRYLAPLVKDYVGIDYAEELTEICRKKFPANKFLTVDVRNMSVFSEKEFDFILFSFNGLDYMPHADRMAALQQIKRVLSPGGYFCFSTHNIRLISTWGRLEFSISPIVLIQNIIKYYKRRSINKLTVEKINETAQADHAILNDGAHYWQLETYYVQIAYQIKILEEIGYKNIRVFDLNGDQLDQEDVKKNKDPWLYYLCS